MDRAIAQICLEAGARVRTNVKLRDLNVSVRAGDERHIEVVASGLPLFGGAQLAVGATLPGVLGRDGECRLRADWQDGAVAEGVRDDKGAAHPELASGTRCWLVVVAQETGGRFSAETADFLRQLALARNY